jgi:hypothetical protein
MARAAEAFEKQLAELDVLDRVEADSDPERFGRRAALLAASPLLWDREVGPYATSAQLADLLGMSKQAVSKRVHGETLLALPRRNQLLYPLFQFGADGQPLPGIAEVIRALKDAVTSTWLIADWLVSRHSELGRAPVEALRDGDVEAVETAARRYAARLHQ